MLDFLVRVVINGAALIVASLLIADIHLKIGPFGAHWLKIAGVALVFALVNTYIKPVIKALSFPISILTLGLVAFVINAGLLLLVAWIDHETIQAGLTIAKFPPTLDGNAVVAALLGSIVISVVSTVLGFADFGRKAVGLR